MEFSERDDLEPCMERPLNSIPKTEVSFPIPFALHENLVRAMYPLNEDRAITVHRPPSGRASTHPPPPSDSHLSLGSAYFHAHFTLTNTHPLQDDEQQVQVCCPSLIFALFYLIGPLHTGTG